VVSPVRFVGRSRYKVLLGTVVGMGLSVVKDRKLQGLSGFAWVVSSLFTMILVVNFAGMLPWSMGMASHAVFSFAFALPLWVVTVVATVSNGPFIKVARVVGSALPGLLAPFVRVVEVFRVGMRPLSLGFRLVANVMAGHIVMGLGIVVWVQVRS